MQGVASAAPLGATFAAFAKEGDWLPAAVAGWACVGVATPVQLMADWKAKRSAAAVQQQVADLQAGAAKAQEVAEDRTRLLSPLREPVQVKRRRVEQEAQQLAMRDQGASIRQLRRALACRKHLDDLCRP